MMQTKLLALKNLFERPSFEPDSLPAHELDLLINLGPKKVDEQYVVSNNSYEILCLLMRIDIKSKGAFPKLTNYLLDVAKGIFSIKAVSQYYFAKTTQRLELLEFDIINKINLYLMEVLTVSKPKSPIITTIKGIVSEAYIPKFQRLVSELSNKSGPIEQNFDKNEILWLRSLLKLPMRNPLLRMFATDDIVKAVKEELRKMMNVSVVDQTHDGFYKTGVFLHLFKALDADLNTLQFASNYANMLIKRYLKFEEINQKLLNPFRLALEACVSFQERFDGYMMESSKTLSLHKLLGGFLTELNGVSETFYVKFINDILKSIEIVFWRIPSIQEKVKVIDIMFNYYMRCKSFSENVQQMIGDNRIVTVGNTGAQGNGYAGSNAPVGGGITINLNAVNLNINDGKYQLPEKKKEETLQRLRIISELVLNYIFKILEQEDFESTLVDYNNSLVYNFIVHVFNTLSTGGLKNDFVRQNGESDVQAVKDPRKFEVYGFKFLYHLVKRFQSTRMNELIYNLISSRYSLKVSLNEMKHVVNSLDEKRSQKLLVKMKLQMSLNIADSKLFQKSMSELMTFYSEVIEDPKFKAQEEFTYSLFKKVIKKAQSEEKLLIVWNQITGFMTKLGKEVINQSKSENLLQYFAKNLECVRDLLWKIVIKKNSSLPRDPKFIEKLIEVWIQIMLQKQYILKVAEPMVQEIALLTPRLIQASATSYSNTFLINTFLTNQKIIDKYRRNMKHVLREKMIELRPKIRNLTLGEMMFLLSIDYILDVKITEITHNYRRILEVKKDIPFIETIFCYVRDVLITEKENLKEVLEELLVRKARSYLTQIMLVSQQRLQMHLVEKDFVTLLQSSCSINRIYMKISQIFIKEFIREFPKLIFQELVISSLCETLEFFYRKLQYQYDSVSSRLKLGHYNLRLAVPNTLKELHEVLVFLLACVHSMCLRGYIIEGGTLLKRVGEVVALPEYKDLKHGVKIIKYILWTLNNNSSLTGDAAVKGAAYWFYDKSYFLGKVDRFENKHLEEGLKVIAIIPTFSFEIHFDAKLVINTLHQTLKEFKTSEGDYAEITALKEKGPSFQKIFDDLKDSLIHFYVYNIIQRDKNYKQHLLEILKDPVIGNRFDKESKDIIISSASKPTNIFEKIKAKMDENYAKVLAALQMAVSYIRIHPEQAFQSLRKIYTLALTLPVRKILKYVIKTLTTHVIRSIPSKFTPSVLRALFFMLQETTYKYNCYTNITAVNKMKQSSFDLLDVNSELFNRIRFKDLFAANNSHPEIRDNIHNKFSTCKEREELQIREVRSLFSIKHFTRVFSSIHKDIMIFMHNHLSVFLTNHIQPLELLNFLQVNFEIMDTSIEYLKSVNIFAAVTTNLAALNILKNHPLTAIQRRFLQKFYANTLKFALAYFSKNGQYYVDDSLESENCISKIEKKIELGLKACRYLKVETFMETAQTAERVDVPTKFPPVFIDLNVITPARTKYIFKFHDSRSRWFYTSLKPRLIGSFGLSKTKKNLSVIYDPSNEKKQVLISPNGLSKFQNLRKLVLVLIGHEIDSIKAFNKTELGHMKYEFTFEDKVLNENEARSMLYFALDLNTQLPVYLIRRLGFALPIAITGAPGFIRDLVTKYYLFHLPYHILFDYFVERNLLFPNILRNCFYWDTPQFPLLMKYMTLEYEGQKTLQIYFTKTMKRLESTQLLFYLPQIYQTLNTQASYLVAQTLKEYSQSSYLFSHQLIWKTKVESKREKGETTNTKIPYISVQLLYQLLKGLNSTERFLFKQVDDFFEAITAISGILNPKWPKKKKEETVAVELKKINVSEYLYVPCNPQYMISKIKLDSGRAMQSAAKCPILVSFYCKRFEGPDKYYEKLLNSDKQQEDIMEEDDLIADNDEQPSINDLKVSSRIKLLPKESLTNFETHVPVADSRPLERISEKEEESSPADVRLKIMKGIEGEQETPVPQSILRPEVIPAKDVRFDFDKPEHMLSGDDDDKEPQLKDEHDISKNGMKLEISLGTMNYISNNDVQREDFSMPNDRQFKTSKFTLHPNNFERKDGALSPRNGKIKNEEKDEEENYEIISCIFKVFDDIRQDDLALQVISLFKYIFQSVGLDLFLYPYRTISNRTGKDLDIGGIIEVVPNTKSRDQMGKEMNCNLYEYFIARFGNEMSPEFQLARENFIKSMAAYSIVSYILQIKDRHNGNILIDPYGHIVHIDFGFIFDISPAHNMKFESANFKLTKEMIQIMGGSQFTEPFNYYADQTMKAFLAVRRFEEQIFNMIKLMTYSGLKCFRPMSLQNLKERFMPRMNELQASLMMKKIILDAYDKLTTNLYDDIQHLQNKIHR